MVITSESGKFHLTLSCLIVTVCTLYEIAMVKAPPLLEENDQKEADLKRKLNGI